MIVPEILNTIQYHSCNHSRNRNCQNSRSCRTIGIVSSSPQTAQTVLQGTTRSIASRSSYSAAARTQTQSKCLFALPLVPSVPLEDRFEHMK